MNSQLQSYLCQMQDILLQLRFQSEDLHTYEMKQQSNYGVILTKPSNLDNRINIQKNWNSTYNELIMLFYLLRNSDGERFIVEQWNIQTRSVLQNKSEQKPQKYIKRASIFMRSFVTLVSLTSYMSEYVRQNKNKFQIKYDFSFNAKGKHNVIDWIKPDALKNYDIQTLLDFDSISVNVACQQNIAPIIEHIQKIQKPMRERFASDGKLVKERSRAGSGDFLNKTSVLTLNKQNTDPLGQSQSTLQRQYVSLFSKRDDVEILSTSQDADQIMEKADVDEFEIQMIIFEDPNEQEKKFEERLSDRIFKQHFKESPQRQLLRQNLLLDIELRKSQLNQDQKQQMVTLIKFIVEQ